LSYEFNPITNELVENGWSQRLDNLMELFSCEKIEKIGELIKRLPLFVDYPIQFLKSFIKVRSKYATSSILTDVLQCQYTNKINNKADVIINNLKRGKPNEYTYQKIKKVWQG